MHPTYERLMNVAIERHHLAGPAEVGRLIGESEQTMSNWKSRGVPKAKHVDIAMIIGCDPTWLANGGELKPAPDQICTTTSTAKTLTIPLLSAVASMGQGIDLASEDSVIDRITLKREWVRQWLPGVNASGLAVISGKGDSMFPTYSDGDLLLVDTTIKAVDIDAVYAMSAHDRLFVKRVRQRLDGHFEISSDNPNVKTVDILNGDHEVSILGRVVWAWNGKRL